jgi:hypothetical protein
MEKQLETVLSELAVKFGTTTERLYAVLVKQAKIKIFKSIIAVSILIILIIIGLHYIDLVHYTNGKIVKTEYSVDTIYPDSNILFMICWGANAILWVISILTINDEIMSLIENIGNPEFFAINTVLSALSKD